MSLCIECGIRERFKLDLLCVECRKVAYGIQEAEKPPCRCECGYTCHRRCELDLDDCMRIHYKVDCDHAWDGPWLEINGGGSVTCSKCGMSCMDHECAVGP